MDGRIMGSSTPRNKSLSKRLTLPPFSLVNDFPVYNLDFLNHTKGDYFATKKILEETFSDPEAKHMVRYNDEKQIIDIYCFPRVFYALIKKEHIFELYLNLSSKEEKDTKDPYMRRIPYLAFDAHFMTNEYKDKEVEKFNSAALAYDKFCFSNKPVDTNFNFGLYERDTPQNAETYVNVCNHLFQNSFGIGDYHDEENPKNFLVSNLASLNHVIFKEGIYYEIQPLIDAFLNDPKQKVASPFLLKLLSYGVYSNNNCEILYECKKLGLRLVGIDTHHSYRSQAFVDDEDNYYTFRVKAMNVYALRIIEKELKNKKQKFIVFAGAAHTKTTPMREDTGIEGGIPGICDILKIPTIQITDIKNKKMSDNHFYILHQSQFPNVESRIEHALKARSLDELALQMITLLIEKDVDANFIEAQYLPHIDNYDIRIEASTSANLRTGLAVPCFKKQNLISQAKHFLFKEASSHHASQQVNVDLALPDNAGSVIGMSNLAN